MLPSTFIFPLHTLILYMILSHNPWNVQGKAGIPLFWTHPIKAYIVHYLIDAKLQRPFINQKVNKNK